MAAQEAAGWSTEQGPCWLLPESVEDPAEGFCFKKNHNSASFFYKWYVLF